MADKIGSNSYLVIEIAWIPINWDGIHQMLLSQQVLPNRMTRAKKKKKLTSDIFSQDSDTTDFNLYCLSIPESSTRIEFLAIKGFLQHVTSISR